MLKVPPLLPSMRSPKRATGLPSAKTLKEYKMNSAEPLVTALTTPPTEPASSPVLLLKQDPCSMIGCPSQVTVLLPLAVSWDIAMFG